MPPSAAMRCCDLGLCVPLPPGVMFTPTPTAPLPEDAPCCACMACGEPCYLPRSSIKQGTDASNEGAAGAAAAAAGSSSSTLSKRGATACCQTTTAQCCVAPAQRPFFTQEHEHAVAVDSANGSPSASSSAILLKSEDGSDGSSDPRDLYKLMLADAPLLARLGEECLSFAMSKGITMARHPAPHANAHADTGGAEMVAVGPTIVQAPLTMLPTRMPAHLYNSVRALVPHLNLLYERVSRDAAFLQRVLRPCAEAGDEYLRRLLDMHTRIEAAQTAYKPQTLALAINRSDYMLDDGGAASSSDDARRLSLKQVEFNTISAGANSLSTRVSALHRHLFERFLPAEQAQRFNLPRNEAISHIVSAMAHAHRLFLAQQQQRLSSSSAVTSKRTVVLFVVQPRESNLADQKGLEYALWDAPHRIPVRRMTLVEVAQESSVDPTTGHLLLRNGEFGEPHIVSLVYFRAAYTPRDFVSVSSDGEAGATEWDALERMHRSVAIKCPSLGYHLAGFKKVQQELTLPGVLERFLLPDVGPEVVEAVRDTFVGMFPPDAEAVERALATPLRFVLKPQREGGGNNLWGAEMVAALHEGQAKGLDSLGGFVLMEVISATSSTNFFGGDARVPTLKQGVVAIEEHAVSELGMVGCMITGEAVSGGVEATKEGGQVDGTAATSDNAGAPSKTILAPAAAASPAQQTVGAGIIIHHNEYAGYLMRTKASILNEGGLMSGAGAIDSLVLI